MSNASGNAPTMSGLEWLAFEVPYATGLGYSPNHRVHWGQRARQTNKVRGCTFASAMLAARGKAFDRARLDITVVWPKGARIKDEDNLRGMLKPALDGLASALLVDDSPKHLELGELIQERNPNRTVPWPVVKYRLTELQLKGEPKP